jgi:hypothetical protein
MEEDRPVKFGDTITVSYADGPGTDNGDVEAHDGAGRDILTGYQIAPWPCAKQLTTDRF